MAEKKKILYIVEAMGGGVFTYIVDLANELVNSYDMYIAYAVRKQTPENYKDYFDKRILHSLKSGKLRKECGRTLFICTHQRRVLWVALHSMERKYRYFILRMVTAF